MPQYIAGVAAVGTAAALVWKAVIVAQTGTPLQAAVTGAAAGAAVVAVALLFLLRPAWRLLVDPVRVLIGTDDQKVVAVYADRPTVAVAVGEVGGTAVHRLPPTSPNYRNCACRVY
jgi:hypothetical protein